MSNIFKFYINNNNIYSKLFIFIGNFKHDIDVIMYNKKIADNNIVFFQDDIFSTYLHRYFLDSEIELLKKNNTRIFLVNDIIFKDDNIETIKLKLINQFIINDLDNISFEELYFYGIIDDKLDIKDFYNKSTNNGRENFTYETLFNYIINIKNYSNILKKIKKSDFYNLNDLLILDKNEIYLEIPIANKIFTKNNKYLNTVNPYNSTNKNKYLKSLQFNNISTTNNDLLFEYNIINNTIYVVLLSDIYKDKTLNLLDEKNLIKTYFPYIYNLNIYTYTDFFTKNIYNIIETKKIIESQEFINKNNVINLFNNITNNTKILNYNYYGITYIDFIIYSQSDQTIPLDYIFKILNSNENIPFIKYNPGKNHDNIYRL